MMRFPQYLNLVSMLGLAATVAAQANDITAAVGMINQARQARGIQPLLWHPDLASYAQLWADRMGSDQEPFHHASGAFRPGQGETLYQEQSTGCGAAYDRPFQSAVQDWLNQAVLYNGQPITTGQEKWLHFCERVCSWPVLALV